MSLNILTLNYYCRPRFLFSDNQVKRTNVFADKLSEYQKESGNELDILCLQEIFDNKVYKIMKKTLKKIGFVYKTERIEERFRINAGGLIFSKHKIIESDKIVFKKSSIFLSANIKGCNYAKIEKDGKKINVINVHLDSFEEQLRTTQMNLINRFIKEQMFPKEELVVICGDFNLDFYRNEMNMVNNIFKYKIPEINSDILKFSVDGHDNDWIKRRDVDNNTVKELIDFFIHNDTVKKSSMKLLKLKYSDEAYDILWSTPFFMNFYNHFKKIKVEDISDHYGMICKLEY